MPVLEVPQALPERIEYLLHPVVAFETAHAPLSENGSIVVRWRSGDFTWSLELEADCSMETSLMEENRLVCRHTLHVQATR